MCSSDSEGALHALARRMEEDGIGWEGAIHGPSSSVSSSSTDKSHASEYDADRRAICLCFEGGPGTIGTVEAAVSNGTPALVVQGTGRAADLIADCLAYYREDGRGEGADPSGADEEDVSQCPTAVRQSLIARFERIMSLSEVEALSARLREKSGPLDFSTAPAKLIETGRELFCEYKVMPPKDTEDSIFAMLDQLHRVVTSGLCLAYRLGSGTDIYESISQCVLRKITQALSPKDFQKQRDAAKEARKDPPAGWSMIGFVAEGLDSTLTSIVKQQRSAQEGLEADDEAYKTLLVEKLRLLAGWGQTRLVKALMQGAKAGTAQDRLLGELLHLALVHNQPDIVALALDRGADLSAYEPGSTPQRDKSLPANRRWVELLIGASDDPEERYLLKLIRKGHARLQGTGAPLATPEKISDDLEAILILNEIVAMVVTEDKALPNDTEFYFTRERNGEWAGADFNLFLFLVVVNRSDLAYIFFRRDAAQNTASMLANALWACLICRNLAKNPDVGKYSYHLKNGFETTAEQYEGIAASILKKAFARSERCAMQALERPLKRYDKWRPLDLLARAECKKLISECPDLCISVVQNRFYGEGSLVAAVERMDDSLNGVLSPIFLHEFPNTPTEATSSTLQSLYIKSSNTLQSVSKIRPEGSDSPGDADSTSNGRLLLLCCIVVDAVGASYYIYPVLPEKFYLYQWAPLNAVFNFALHRSTCLAMLALVEEMLPIVDLLPLATIGFLLAKEKKREEEHGQLESENSLGMRDTVGRPSFVPFDHFILDVLSHCFLAYLLSVILLMTPSIATLCLELLVLSLILLDELPDIIFEGIEEQLEKNARDENEITKNDEKEIGTANVGETVVRAKTNTFSAAFLDGFDKYLSNSGYVRAG